MKILSWLPVLALVFAASARVGAQQPNPPRYTLSYDRFGPVRIGMTVRKASRALRVSLIKEEGYDEKCHYVRPKSGFSGISFMVTLGRISRIDVQSGSYRTVAGARIGDTESRIKRLYAGRVHVAPHPYVDWAHYLTVEFRGGRFLILFETDGKRVTTYRIGKNPEAGFVEGCS